MLFHMKMIHQVIGMIGSGLLAASSVHAQAPVTAEDLPWFLKLGESSMQLRARTAVAKQVVLVPDLQTLADEVSNWTPDTQWPVLIEDDFLTPMFIRRFRPQVVLRRSSIGAWQGDPASEMESAAAAAWDGLPGQSPRAAALAAKLPVPSGIVIANSTDPAAAAAVILAAGRGQDILWTEGSFGKPDDVLSAAGTAAVVKKVEAAAASSGLEWQTLGDSVDTLTICQSMSARGHTAAAVAIPAEQGGPVAMTDVLGRNASGQRWAVAGWIFGSGATAAYQANCSLFLPRVDVWACGTYPDSAPWANWAMAPAASELSEKGYRVTALAHETLQQLHASDMNGLEADLLLMNSKGNADFFRMADGHDGDSGDVPVLDRPAALSMIHSWSLRSPADRATVGGRWLLHGVYAYIGSSEEPQLQAFVPPALLAKRIAGGIPFLVAGRWWPRSEQPMARTWRINTIGDPLMIIPPPRGSIRRPAKAVSAANGSTLVDVKQLAVARMQAAQSNPTDTTMSAAIREVALLGMDPMAAKLWEAAGQKEANGPLSARAAFGSLYRTGDHGALINAWQRLNSPTMMEGDMLWAALGPVLGQGTSDAALAALGQALSPGGVVSRITRLAPLLAERYGSGAATAAIDRAMSIATTTRQRRAIQALR